MTDSTTADRARTPQAAVRRYFEARYPDRESRWSQFFRSGEHERAAVIARLLPGFAGKTVCDVGCGDGTLIERLVREQGAPARLVLRDISSTALAKARTRLKNLDNVTALAGDAWTVELGSHDIVLAIGVTDYYRNWDDILRMLVAHADETLIVDFPRAGRLRNIARSLWLRRHGIGLHSASRRSVDEILKSHARTFVVMPTKYNWIVKLDTRSV